MKISKVMVSYNEKRSGNYQAVDYGLMLEVELAEGESPKQAIDKYTPILRDSVTQVTETEIERLINEAKNGPRQPANAKTTLFDKD